MCSLDFLSFKLRFYEYFCSFALHDNSVLGIIVALIAAQSGKLLKYLFFCLFFCRYYMSYLRMEAHTGTHIDAPAHFSKYHMEEGGITVEKVCAGLSYICLCSLL